MGEESRFRVEPGVIVFRDSLREGHPCVFQCPRNHESLFYVTEGCLQYDKDGKTDRVPSGGVGYIGKGSRDVSSAYECPQVSYIAFNFNFSSIGEKTDDGAMFSKCCLRSAGQYMENLFQNALRAYRSKRTGYDMVCMGILMQIMGEIRGELENTEKRSVHSDELLLGLNFLEQHFDEPELTVTAMADHAGLNERTFRRSFLTRYGVLPYQYLQEYRIRSAGTLLIHTEMLISEIAVQCGFSDIYAFSHCFRRHTGLSPQEYRERSRNAVNDRNS